MRRRVIAVLLSSLAVLFALAATASASPLTDAATALRARAGLGPAPGSSAVGAHILQTVMSAETRQQGYDDLLDAEPGLQGRFAIFTVDPGRPPLESMAVVAMLADPRLTSIDEADTAGGQVIVTTVDTGRPWSDPIAVPQRLDPTSADGLIFVLPGDGYDEVYELERYHDGTWTALGESIDPMMGDDTNFGAVDTGAAALRVGSYDIDGVPLGARLRLRSATGAGEFSTVPASAISKPGFRFAKNMTPGDRRIVNAAVRASRPQVRAIIAQLDGFTTIERYQHSGMGEIGTGGTDPDSNGYQVRLLSSYLRKGKRRDVQLAVLHELGHVVQFSGLNERASAQIDRLIPRGGRCGARDPRRISNFPSGPCAPDVERFADTFAKWALGVRSMHDLGYHVPAPRSFGPFGRLVTRSYQFVLPGLGRD